MNINRRGFLRNAVAGSAALTAIPEILSAAMHSSGSGKHKSTFDALPAGSVVLFQGDSITDAGREKEKQLPNSTGSFGTGYALMAAASILNAEASKNFLIYNRGISGNKVYQLADRWQKDCFDLNPALLSILIGVNDFWHKLNGKYEGTIKKYETDYRQLLTLTTKMIPNIRLVICEPFAVKGCSAVDDRWFPEFDLYRHAAEKLAKEFNAIFVPCQSIFDEALKRAPGTYWTLDGVHPSMAGASLMAEAWLKAVR
jgi:lysophospholipase L1-like esterase